MLSGCGGSKAPSAPLVFVKGRNVYVYDVGARTTRRLTSARDAVGDLALSPDGRSVAYTAAVHNGTDIRVVPLKRGPGRDVTPWESFAGVHTHIEPGWLSATQLVYVGDQRAASAAIGAGAPADRLRRQVRLRAPQLRLHRRPARRGPVRAACVARDVEHRPPSLPPDECIRRRSSGSRGCLEPRR